MKQFGQRKKRNNGYERKKGASHISQSLKQVVVVTILRLGKVMSPLIYEVWGGTGGTKKRRTLAGELLERERGDEEADEQSYSKS